MNGGFLSASGVGSVFFNDVEVSNCEGFFGGAFTIEEAVKIFINESRFLNNRAVINAGEEFFLKLKKLNSINRFFLRIKLRL